MPYMMAIPSDKLAAFKSKLQQSTAPAPSTSEIERVIAALRVPTEAEKLSEQANSMSQNIQAGFAGPAATQPTLDRSNLQQMQMGPMPMQNENPYGGIGALARRDGRLMDPNDVDPNLARREY